MYNVSNIAPAIKGWLDSIQELSGADNLNYIMDEKFTYESGVKKFRSDNKMANDTPTPFPLLIFKRTVLRHWEDGMGRRAQGQLACTKSLEGPNVADLFKLVLGAFDIEFMYVTREVHEMENFEIRYLAEAGEMDQSKLFTITIPQFSELGEDPNFEFSTVYDTNLEEKLIESDGVCYKAVMGKATIMGTFFVATETKSNIIKSIQCEIQNFVGEQLLNSIIP